MVLIVVVQLEELVFVPRIERDLQTWVKSHNSHPVRTEKNQTPFQLWYPGSIMYQENDSTAINNLLMRPILLLMK